MGIRAETVRELPVPVGVSAYADWGLSARADSRQSADAEIATNDLRRALRELPREKCMIPNILRTAVDYRRERERFWRENENEPVIPAHPAQAAGRRAPAKHRIGPPPREPRNDCRALIVHPDAKSSPKP